MHKRAKRSVMELPRHPQSELEAKMGAKARLYQYDASWLDVRSMPRTDPR
jgi:hypothetical protein